MRTLLLGLILLSFGPFSIAYGQTQSFRAGIARIEVPAATPFEALIWYPTQADEVSWQTGPVLVPATHDAQPAAGNFPVVLLSHGGGLTGGSPLLLKELSASLARQGFIVVAPFHGTAGLPVRPFQVQLALAAMLDTPRFAMHADPARLGMVGFSLGGAVTLKLAGAIQDEAHFAAHCVAHPEDVMSCNNAPSGRRSGAPSPGPLTRERETPLPPHLALKAVVLLDPLAALFPRDGLRAVTMPVLLIRPEQSKLSGEGNADTLALTLPVPPLYQKISGGHFVFADPCTPSQKTASPEVCLDPSDVDRAAVHAGVESMVTKFLAEKLQ